MEKSIMKSNLVAALFASLALTGVALAQTQNAPVQTPSKPEQPVNEVPNEKLEKIKQEKSAEIEKAKKHAETKKLEAEKEAEKAKQQGEKALGSAGGVKPGDVAPPFSLTDTDGKAVDLASLLKDGDKIIVLEWFNPDCPFVVKHHEKNPTFKNLHAKWKDKGVTFIAINSGAKGEQGNGQERNVKAKKEYEIGYPVLLDESGDVGRLYGAKRTPHMFVIGKTGKVEYAGAIDNNRSADKPGDINYVDQALTELTAGSNVTTKETEAYGCSVKYAKKKEGN
jgi:peroxiredoxin